jgi:hypothetical protein
MAEEDNQSLYNENNENIRVRTLRDHMNPTRTSAPSCIVFPPDASHFNFKPDIIQLLPSFHGLDLENPYLHLREFEEVCNTYNDSNCSMNTIRLKLFPFSLKDKAKTWLQNLRPGSIRVTTRLSKPKTIVNFFYIYIYLIHMVTVIKELESLHHQNTIHTINSSFKSESYTNT